MKKAQFNKLLFAALLGSTVVATMLKTKAQQTLPSAEGEYFSPAASIATGKAPGMKVRLLSESGSLKNYSVIFAKGDEVMSGLTDFAKENGIKSARFTAIGAFTDATVAWFDDRKKQFKLIPINQQVELVLMVGDIALANGEPAVHTHVAVASSDGTVRGGHLIQAHVFPTLELFLTAYPTPLEKKLDESTGLMLIDPSLTHNAQ